MPLLAATGRQQRTTGAQPATAGWLGGQPWKRRNGNAGQGQRPVAAAATAIRCRRPWQASASGRQKSAQRQGQLPSVACRCAGENRASRRGVGRCASGCNGAGVQRCVLPCASCDLRPATCTVPVVSPTTRDGLLGWCEDVQRLSGALRWRSRLLRTAFRALTRATRDAKQRLVIVLAHRRYKTTDMYVRPLLTLTPGAPPVALTCHTSMTQCTTATSKHGVASQRRGSANGSAPWLPSS